MIDTSRLKIELKRARLPLAWYAVLVLAGLIAFVVIVRNLTIAYPWDSYRTFAAQFTDVKGIYPGKDQLRISGVPVGVVSGMRLVGGEPVLTLEEQSKYGPIYRNATLVVRPITPLDDMYVDIVNRGTPSAGVATTTAPITVAHTSVPIDISRILDEFGGDTRQRLTVLLSELGSGLGDRGWQLRAAFEQLAPFLLAAQRATTQLATLRSNTAQLIHNFGSLTTALGTRDGQLQTMIHAGDVTLGQIAQADGPLSSTLTELPPTLTEIRSAFQAVRTLETGLDPALRGLAPVARVLPAGLSALRSFGQTATPALAAIRPTITHLVPFVNALASTSVPLQSALARLRPQAPQYNELTSELATCRTSAEHFFNNTLQVFKFADANGSFPRAEITEDSDAVQLGQPLSKGLTLRRIPSCTDQIVGGG